MSQEDNIATVRRFWDGFNNHNLDVWDEVCTDKYINHDPGLPVPDADLKTTKEIIGGMQAALPDLKATEEDLIAAGDNVVVRMSFRGTHKAELMGVPASGNEVSFTGIFIHRLKDGKIEEEWVGFDALGFMRQIGAIPPAS